MRTLGGSIGLAAGVIVFNLKIRSSDALNRALTQHQLSGIYKSPLAADSLTTAERRIISRVYADAFSSEMQTATYVAAACLLATLLTWQRHPPFRGPPGSGPPKPAKEPERKGPYEKVGQSS
jgi:hypothetical protein